MPGSLKPLQVKAAFSICVFCRGAATCLPQAEQLVVWLGDFGQGLWREFAPRLLRQSTQFAAALYHAGAVACRKIWQDHVQMDIYIDSIDISLFFCIYIHMYTVYIYI